MKLVLATLLLVMAASMAFAQTTTVTLQVTDADSQAWNSAPYTVTTAAAQLQSLLPVATVTGTLSASGGASFTLSAGTYTFRVTPLASSVSGGTYGNAQTPVYSSSVAISGSTQTVTLAPAAIRMPLVTGVAVKAYSDVEVTGATYGSHYFNITLGLDREWNGAAWMDEGVSLPVVFASLPACAAGLEGLRRPVTDSTTITWGATVTGGSTSHILAYCDGTNWTVVGK